MRLLAEIFERRLLPLDYEHLFTAVVWQLLTEKDTRIDELEKVPSFFFFFFPSKNLYVAIE